MVIYLPLIGSILGLIKGRESKGLRSQSVCKKHNFDRQQIVTLGREKDWTKLVRGIVYLKVWGESMSLKYLE